MRLQGMQQTAFQPLSIAELATLRDLIDRAGIVEAARLIGLGREALARLVGSLPARRGSHALVRAALSRGLR